eukprot:gene8700-5635_t
MGFQASPPSLGGACLTAMPPPPPPLTDVPVWPLPTHVDCAAGAGAAISSAVTVSVGGSGSAGGAVTRVVVAVASDTEALTAGTDYGD